MQFSLTESSVVVRIATRDWEVRGTRKGAACGCKHPHSSRTATVPAGHRDRYQTKLRAIQQCLGICSLISPLGPGGPLCMVMTHARLLPTLPAHPTSIINRTQSLLRATTRLVTRDITAGSSSRRTQLYSTLLQLWHSRILSHQLLLLALSSLQQTDTRFPKLRSDSVFYFVINLHDQTLA